MPSCGGFLEPKKSRLGPSKCTFNAENFLHSFFMSIPIDFGAIRSWNVSRRQKLTKKINKTPLFWRPRSSKVSEFGGSRKPVHDFLLVIYSNLGPISHRYWDTATYLLKMVNFCTLLSFCALDRGDVFWILGKALRNLKLESSWQSTVKNFVILACVMLTQYRSVTDERTDGRMLRRWL